MPPVPAKVASDQDLADIYAFLLSGAPAQQAETLTGDSQKGKQMFMAYGCYQCHGTVGQGTAREFGLVPPPLSQSFFAQIRSPPRRTDASLHDKVASDQDLADIYSYLKSVPPRQRAADIPLLNQ